MVSVHGPPPGRGARVTRTYLERRIGATDSIADLLLSRRLRTTAQSCAEAPSRTSGARGGRASAVRSSGCSCESRSALTRRRVVLHLTVRPFRGPSQQRPVVRLTPPPLFTAAPEHALTFHSSPRPVMVQLSGPEGIGEVLDCWPASMWTARCCMSAAYCSTRRPGRSERSMVFIWLAPVGLRYHQRTFIVPSTGPRPSRERRPLR